MAGFELSKFTPAPQPELICGICMGVLEKPYETPCRHVFCRLCILRALKAKRKCPICRAPCMRKKCKEVLPIVQQLINKLTMRCNNFRNGCTELIPKERFLEHIKTCPYAMVQCRHKGCGQKLLEKDRENHERNICSCKGGVVCVTGCSRPAPCENASPDKCTKALVKNAKKKNMALEKRIGERHQAPVRYSKLDSPVAPRDNQKDDIWNSYSTIHGDNTSIAFGKGLTSQQYCFTNISNGGDGSQIVDCLQGVNICYRKGQMAALSVRSEYVYSGGDLEYQAHAIGTSETDIDNFEKNESPFAFRNAPRDEATKTTRTSASSFCDDNIRRRQLFVWLFVSACCLSFVMIPMMWHIL